MQKSTFSFQTLKNWKEEGNFKKWTILTKKQKNLSKNVVSLLETEGSPLFISLILEAFNCNVSISCCLTVN